MTGQAVDHGTRPRGPQAAPRHVALMVCTLNRRQSLARFLESAAALKIPPGSSFELVVADNNPVSQHEAYIKQLLAALDFPCRYGHEPERGYANARNLALELALQTPADLLAFADDDMELDEDWLTAHLRSHAEFDCDVIGGAIHRKGGRYANGRRFAHGEVCKTQGTGNVSFRRWMVDENGLGLRFDTRFNETGGEDLAFFDSARQGGCKIVFSRYPVVHDTASFQEDWLAELENKARVSAITHRNSIVRTRKERGLAPAVLRALWGMRFGVKGLIAYTDYLISLGTGRQTRAKQKRISADKNLGKVVQGFGGLHGDYVARQSMRRSSFG